MPDASASMDDAGSSGEDASAPSGDAGNPLIAARPYRVHAPGNYTTLGPLPLVVLLHGYGANATGQEAYFALGPQVSERRFLLALPDGTRDASGKQFWNATDACCNFLNAPVDDVAYLRALIADMKARYNVDSNRVYVIGHSNGGFMALRMACEMSDEIAAVMSLAGAGFADAMRCAPSRSVHVLQVHGDADAVVQFAGASGLVAGGPPYPGAERTVGDWAARNGCSMTRMSSGADLDLDIGLVGPETTREAHAGCRAGGSAELWRIRGGSHIPTFTAAWAPSVIDWLYAHARSM
jgi:polyhydroxybutyrate depolymerase